ncbi:Piso0_002297 [Millerozyma farinosa CBS 7064]|uniref:Piso0_002297 protein n=1 Tax=Pichia sorbitophila (strain ATCC MYA-4447 / BCRC 22081 / CBS 7064 / NBRC 10061 / NRRL Y-12695) TaxID=559304 RepID=G8YC86_PICSO|nr:Piso0_002297 [Millerozyma farinosa CBS 7064]
MSFRHFPMVKTCKAFYFNITHLKSPSRRPAFKSVVHPFSTNVQLLDASYSNWLLKTSKSIPSKIFRPVKYTAKEGGSTGKNSHHAFKNMTALCLQTKNDSAFGMQGVFEESDSTDRNEHFRDILELAFSKQFSALRDKIKEMNDTYGTIEPDLMNTVFSIVTSDMPSRETLPNDDLLEEPMYMHKNKIGLNSEYYKFLQHSVPQLHSLHRSYEHILSNNKQFQENYIWLCYHQNDVDSLQRLVYMYLKNSEYNSKILGYILSCFALNFEVEFAKNVFQNLLALNKEMSPLVLDVLTSNFIKMGSLFENTVNIFYSWVNTPNTRKPYPETVARLLGEYYRYGRPDEISSFLAYIDTFGYSHHHRIDTVGLKYKIINRHLYSLKKRITKGDFQEIRDISNALEGRKNEKISFYYSMMEVFCKYSNVRDIEFLVRFMKEDGITLDKSFHYLISMHLVYNAKFFQLIHYIDTLSKEIKFDKVFLSYIYEGFVSTFPHHASLFASEFSKWIMSTSSLPDDNKDSLLSYFQLKKQKSQYIPYTMKKDILDTRKYDSLDWKELNSLKEENSADCPLLDQVTFRVTRGFKDVLRKGVKPDIKVLEETFRKSNKGQRQSIWEILRLIRASKQITIKFKIIEIQSHPSVSSLMSFFEAEKSNLNANNRITAARIFFNNRLFAQAEQLLENIDPEEMNDRARMIQLNLSLRNYLDSIKLSNMVHTVKHFPINDIVLSPYINTQCCYIEKNIKKKLAKEQNKKGWYPSSYADNSNGSSPKAYAENDTAHRSDFAHASTVEGLKTALHTVRGLIGDIQIRLSKDKLDIRNEIDNMFKFLDKWITSGDDKRKI